jgi:CRP/FNR family cyclic AMP-dependent transcriptional regulator
MKTPIMPIQARSGISALPKILVHANFSPAPDKALRKESRMDVPGESMTARLAKFRLFAGMNRGQLALLAGCAVAVQFKKGEVIFREGDLADRLYLIETGKVSLESSRGMDDPRLGWSWMFPAQTRTYTTHAIEPTTAIFLYGSVLRECCENDHSFGYELLKRMSFMMYQRRQAVQNRMRMGRNHRDALSVSVAVAA